MTKKLIQLAKISPKKYATTIRNRNTSLLKRLMLLEPYIGKNINDIPRNIWYKVTKRTEYGCPHCGYCCECLWTKVVPKRLSYGCLHVKFGNISYHKLDKLPLSIGYAYNYEYVSFYNFGYTMILTKENWQKCVDFIQAHIDWANLLCWGEKCEHS